ncbi:hypothetical protein AVEN_64998-1, partial [Araneus ventricosus]
LLLGQSSDYAVCLGGTARPYGYSLTSVAVMVSGLFHWDHLPYVVDRSNLTKEYPTLPEMVDMAIKVLSKGDEGFTLLVEARNSVGSLWGTEPEGFRGPMFDFVTSLLAQDIVRHLHDVVRYSEYRTIS